MATEPGTDFSTMSENQVITVAKRARQLADTARDQHLEECGRACAYLHGQGWTWERIGSEMGVNLTTVYRWARPFLTDGI